MSLKKFTIPILVVLILFLGLFARTYRLADRPAGFFCDEAATGYNAYTLLKTGQDEYGESFPLFFRSFGNYRLPIPIYLTVPSIAAFGLNEFSSRLPSAIFGTLNILILYLLVKEMFKKRWLALLSAFFLAISPWHIHFSRYGEADIFFPFFLSLSLYLFLKGLRKEWFLYLSFFFFAITAYTYYPAIIVSPLFLLGTIIIYWPQLLKIKKQVIFASIIFILIISPLANGLIRGPVRARWNQVSAFQTKSHSPQLFGDLAQTYFAHFSSDFLFAKGDINYPGHFITRFSVRGLGELYWFQLPLLILGFIFLIRRFQPESSIIILWLILYPLGSTLAAHADGGGPFATRSITGVIPLQIVSALGLINMINIFQKIRSTLFGKSFITSVLIVLFILLSFFSFKSYFHRYLYEYPLYSSNFWGWQYGPREVMDYFEGHASEYDELFLMGNFNSPEIFLKFYDPENSCQGKCKIGDLRRFDSRKRQLFAIGTDRIDEISPYFRLEEKEVVMYPDKNPAFIIGVLKIDSNRYVR